MSTFFYFIDGRAKRTEEACGAGCDAFVCQRGAGHAMPHIAYREDGGAIGMWSDPIEPTETTEALARVTSWIGAARIAGDPFNRGELHADLTTLKAALTEGAEAVEVLRALGAARNNAEVETLAAQAKAREAGDEDWRDHQGDPRPKWDAYDAVRALADRLTATRPSAEGAK